jgi:hypothetical protein
MQANIIEAAIKECLLNYEYPDDTYYFADTDNVKEIIAGPKKLHTSRSIVSRGVDRSKFPAIQIICDAGSGEQDWSTTNEIDIIRPVLITSIYRSLQISEAIEKADFIRHRVHKVMSAQRTFEISDGSQRDLLSKYAQILGSTPMLVKDVQMEDLKPFLVDNKFWYIHAGLMVNVFYTENIDGYASGIKTTMDKYYTQEFVNARVVTVEHNLDKMPDTTILDEFNQEVDGDVEYVSNDILILRFGAPLTGKVICN